MSARLVAKVPPPRTVDPLSATPQGATALELRVVASPPLAPRPTWSPARPRCWTLAGDQFGSSVWGECSLTCNWTAQESCLTKEVLLLGQIGWRAYVCYGSWSLAPAKLGTLFTASYSKVGTDSTVASVVSFSDPEKSRFPPKRTPRVLHLPEF